MGPQGPEGPSGANAVAQASGLVAWTFDPSLISDTVADNSGTIHGAAVWFEQGETIHWLAEFVSAPGTAMTHGGYAIYDSDSPDAFENATAESWLELPLADAYTVPATGLYYLVDLVAADTQTPLIGVVQQTGAELDARNVLPNDVPLQVRDAGPSTAFPATLIPTNTNETRCMIAG